MIVGNFNKLPAKPVTHPDAQDAAMKVLISPNEGWDGYVMRVVEVETGGHTPKHAHDWPHINYVIEGNGTILIGDTLHAVESGSYAYIPNNTLHQFSNTGNSVFKFICIVPEEGHQ
ncbi:cupin domain-containing protein [Fusibacter tunisiensis]|uniref:Quercetin dioxygenase-like cupin family protein n=1 Tax=Fusibacter tunisiensis TaxID=1008308 RepID=A0ABS2MSS6_9FIRM|nr:cupin domain-containing protein [Fusibacter tunisiensis]MBM7562337.1 quercetin dioxygenase-like cupin family protein [Fusibacter tunisiensis]